MTIANESTILATDLDTAFSVYTTSLRDENRRSAGVFQLPFDFEGVLDVTDEALRSQSFTVGDDDWELLDVGCRVVGSVGTYTVTLTGPLVEPVSITGNINPSPGDLPRYGSSQKPMQVLLRGATYTVTVSTAASAGSNRMRVFLLLKLRPRRR